MDKVVIRRPDWREWAHIPSVGLKSAVSLSLDIEPRCVEKLFTAWWGKVEKDSHKQQIIESLSVLEGFEDFGEWVSRLNIAVSNLGRGVQVTARPRPTHWMVGVGLPEDSEVDLVSFGRFMESIGRKLPEGFPVAKDIAKPIQELKRETEPLTNPIPQQEPLMQQARDSLDNLGGDFDSDSELYPNELDIANIAWRAVAKGGQGGEGTPKQRLERWLRESGYALSGAEIGRIAAVCNWDKSAGRPKGK